MLIEANCSRVTNKHADEQPTISPNRLENFVLTHTEGQMDTRTDRTTAETGLCAICRGCLTCKSQSMERIHCLRAHTAQKTHCHAETLTDFNFKTVQKEVHHSLKFAINVKKSVCVMKFPSS